MGWISMGAGMAISNARYKRRQREAEARRSQAGDVGAALMVLSAKGAYKGFHKLADAGDALKPASDKILGPIGDVLTKTHARTWATIGFYITFVYLAGTRPDESATPSLYEVVTVIAITALGYLVGWLIGKWVGEPDETAETDSVCETEMLLLAGDEHVTCDTQDTVDSDHEAM